MQKDGKIQNIRRYYYLGISTSISDLPTCLTQALSLLLPGQVASADAMHFF